VRLLSFCVDMSSTDVQQQGNTLGGSRAPPPTPSQGGNSSSSATTVNNDAFSAFLEKSLGFSSLVLTESPLKTSIRECDLPVIDLSSAKCDLVRRIADSAVEFGFFQVINHGLPCDVAERAEKECDGLFELSLEKKEAISRSIESPFGFEDGGCDTSTSAWQESFWLEKEASQIEGFIRNIWPEGCGNLSCALGDYSSALEKVGGEILDHLLEGLGDWDRTSFIADIATNNASLIYISNQKGPAKPQSSRLKHSYPFILSLQYQNTSDDVEVYVDRSWVRVSPQAGTLLVTLGDVMKVWSNGEYKSTLGRPTVTSEQACTSMALIYSPPTESIICPIPEVLNSDDKRPHYTSFAMKDYASRLRKQRLLFKDPVERYRIL